jgi:hypothetical protein
MSRFATNEAPNSETPEDVGNIPTVKPEELEKKEDETHDQLDNLQLRIQFMLAAQQLSEESTKRIGEHPMESLARREYQLQLRRIEKMIGLLTQKIPQQQYMNYKFEDIKQIYDKTTDAVRDKIGKVTNEELQKEVERAFNAVLAEVNKKVEERG